MFEGGAVPALPVGSALGKVPTGFAKLSWLNRLKISARSSTFGPRPTPIRLAITMSICWVPGP